MEKKLVVSKKNGFSLVEVIIALSVASLGTLFIIRMQSEQVKKAATAKSNSESEVLIGDIRGLLTRSGYCTTSMAGLILPDAGQLSIRNIRSPNGKIIYFLGEKIADATLEIKDM